MNKNGIHFKEINNRTTSSSYVFIADDDLVIPYFSSGRKQTHDDSFKSMANSKAHTFISHNACVT